MMRIDTTQFDEFDGVFDDMGWDEPAFTDDVYGFPGQGMPVQEGFGSLEEELLWEDENRDPEASKGKKSKKKAKKSKGKKGKKSAGKPADKPASDGSTASKPSGTKKKPKRSTWNMFVSLMLKIGIIICLSVVLFYYVFGLLRNDDIAMNDSILSEDTAIVYRLDKEYAAGDLAFISHNNQNYALRVVALAGDTVDIQEGFLTVNGNRYVVESAKGETTMFEEGIDFPCTVGDGQVFLMGDNRENSTDSRIFGPVNCSETLGSVIGIIRRY